MTVSVFLKDLLLFVWTLLRDLTYSLAVHITDSTGLFEGHPEYLIGLGIIVASVYWRLS